MKFSITIDGDTQDSQSVSVLSLLLAIGNGTVPAIPAFQPATPAIDPDEVAPATPADPSARDTKGLPWDERIHAKSRATNADGSWRARRNVNADLVTSVEAELRARSAAPLAPPATPASVVAASPVPPTSPAPVAAPPAPPEPVAPAAPVAPPAAPVPAGAPADFGALMEIVSKSMSANKMDSEGKWMTWLCSQPDVAVTQITEVAASPAKIAAFYNHMVAQNIVA